ncbi:group 1 glycosyl transferase [Adhaeribacter arboris]|uniref:Group 1 glycosyl transferase n=1 Tax=Adhaeribacter arboris TaxID=2072846 RepID=A0A2T2Y9G7_9BACT|nr:glycosyltransferase [Adhaeribacter arboris]PSR52068.1 group 1 glycosyl transferase [Adhaeribacter arboris]
MKILFVAPYPHGKAPSQRFRFEQYFGFIKEESGQYTFASFLDEKTWNILYKPGHSVQKVWGILKGFFKRFVLLFLVPKFDFIFIHREATPIGPPWFEWIVAKVLQKKIIYDFDDAIWLPNTSENNKIVAGIKWHHKVKAICGWAYKVSCGNSFLCEFAKQFNPNAFVNPTTIDTIHLHNQVKNQNTNPVVIGWTGTHSTMKYLDQIVPVLQELEKEFSFEFRVISDREPDWSLRSLVYKPWQKETEIADLLHFHVGLMPLEDDIWAKGKCAFKALQYMALGIPALVSPVGMNTEVVEHGINGFICNNDDQWYANLEEIISKPKLREDLGVAARQKIEQYYAVTGNRLNFLGFFV